MRRGRGSGLTRQASPPVLQLQSTVGNKAVQRLFEGGLNEMLADAMTAARAAGGISADVLSAMAMAVGSKKTAETIGKAIGGGETADVVAAVLAAQAGRHSEVELTDVVFKIRHPERATRKLVPGDPADAALIKEWVAIRGTIIRPILGKLGIAGVGGKGPKTGAKGGPGTGILATVFGKAKAKAKTVPEYQEQIVNGLKALDAALGVSATVERIGRQLDVERLIVMSMIITGSTDLKSLAELIFAIRHPGVDPRDPSSAAELRAIGSTVVGPAHQLYMASVLVRVAQGIGAKLAGT